MGAAIFPPPPPAPTRNVVADPPWDFPVQNVAHHLGGDGLLAMDELRSAAEAGPITEDQWRAWSATAAPPQIGIIGIDPGAGSRTGFAMLPAKRAGKSFAAMSAAVNRATAAVLGLNGGWLTMNEVRRMEGLDDISE